MTREPDPSATVGQLVTFAGKLAEALDDAELFGGLAGLRGNMKASTLTKLAGELALLRDEIDGQLAALERTPRRRRSP